MINDSNLNPSQSTPWEVRMSNSRRIHYFYNTETRESRWDAPPELTEAEIQQLPGAAQHIKGIPAPATTEGQARASHILIKHRGSRRPSSWKEVSLSRPFKNFNSPTSKLRLLSHGLMLKL